MDALTHRLAAALGACIEAAGKPTPNGDTAARDEAMHEAAEAAVKVHAEYDQRCKEQSGLDHYHGREGG